MNSIEDDYMESRGNNMLNNTITNKLIVLGIDGLDPSLAKKFVDQGKMPALKQYMEMGSAREDLVLLGGVPTVTPPMWILSRSQPVPSPVWHT